MLEVPVNMVPDMCGHGTDQLCEVVGSWGLKCGDGIHSYGASKGRWNGTEKKLHSSLGI